MSILGIGSGDRSSSTSTANNNQVGAENTSGIILGAVNTRGGNASSRNSGGGGKKGRGNRYAQQPLNNVGPGTGGGGSNNSPSVFGSGNVQEIVTETNNASDPATIAAFAQITHDALAAQAALAAESIAAASQYGGGQSGGTSVGVSLGGALQDVFGGGQDQSGQQPEPPGNGASPLFDTNSPLFWVSVAGVLVGLALLVKE